MNATDPPISRPSGVDRRRHRRYPVTLPATVRHAGNDFGPAHIKDICLGGALISGLPSVNFPHLQAGSPLTLLLSFPGLEADDGTTLPALMVRRLSPQAIAVQFAATDGHTRRKLESYINLLQHQPTPGFAGTPLDDLTRERGRGVFARMQQQRISEILDQWMQHIENALWAQANLATSDSTRRTLIETASRFSQQRQSRPEQLLQQIRQSISDNPAGEASQTDSELSLMEPDAFENWLEHAALINELEDTLAEPLDRLKSQILRVFTTFEGNCLLPEQLAQGLESWMDAIALPSPAKRVGLNSGRQVLPRLLGSYYRDLSRALEETGVHAERSEGSRKIVISDARTTKHGRPHATGTRSAQTDANRTASNNNKTQGETAPLTAAEMVELLMALPADTLSIEQLVASGHSPTHQALEALSQTQPMLANQPLSPVLRERIEATGRMLNHLTTQTSGNDRVKAWIEQLSGRLMTAALSDNNFFRSPGHPLWQLLSQLEDLALYLSDNRDSASQQTLSRLDGLITEAVELDVREHDGYGKVITEVTALRKQQGREFQQEIEKAIERLEGQYRHRKARESIESELEKRFAGKRIHRELLSLIDTAWRKLLTLRYLREGATGEQIQHDWSVLDRIHRLFDLPPGELIAPGVLPSLAQDITASFSYIGIDPHQLQTTLWRLQKAARSLATGITHDTDFVIYPSAAQTEESLPPAELSETELALQKQLETLPLGTVLYARKAGKDVSLRLLWRSPDEQEYAFLHTQDRRVRLYSQRTLIKAMFEGRIRLRQSRSASVTEQAIDDTLREMQDHLRNNETRDTLTGLHTLPQFFGNLANAMQPDSANPFATLALVEIDHPELMQTTQGYAAIEHFAKQLATLCATPVSGRGLAANAGRLCYALALEEEITDARMLCDQLRHAIHDTAFEWQGQRFSLTVSIGLLPMPQAQTAPDVLLSSLEVACATAREAGGNRLMVLGEDDSIIDAYHDRLHWLNTVEDVIKAERIRLRMQKIAPVNPACEAQHHYEILMSAYDAQDQLLDLERFIATAEAFSLMDKVDRLVIRKALCWAGQNPAQLEAMGGIAINLSGLSVSDPQILAFIHSELKSTGVPSNRISFELTETAAITSLDRAVEIVGGLQLLGCQVALDDFGTGMSSYSYLKRMPVDFVKIDGSFIKDILNNQHDLAIVRSISEIAHFMGIQTIAEYVENDETIQCLAELGVDFVQGYAVHKPSLLEELQH